MNQHKKQAAKVALITGGARRVGAAIVTLLHQAGYNVAIHCRFSVAEAQALADSLNMQRDASAVVLQKELIGEDAAAELIKSTVSWAGRLDLLVNNASIFARTDCHTFNAADWHLLFDIHVKAPFLLSMAAQPLLAKHQGVIINLTDIHAEKPLKGYAAYCQSKAALEMQTKALALEFAPEIRVNAVAPGAIAWPEQDNALSEEAKQKIINKTPLQRHGSPEHIALAVLALAQNSFITGQIVKVDGGRSLF